ncbi:hypothetical protein [Streptomyces sp. NBC_01257]|uniref:hypothetical protein n=1 Tax=Streptomyces sp. NBC_01257 TaxID=2903799 RepID=UPI002DDC61B2|nr:hypothetical protein [Streptomyces sp. NBC_01257]WRZ62522.1 hypothetical protein OG408_00915 [Streptomyces sp. NBC_01257]
MDNSEYDELDATIRVPKGARLLQSSKTAGARRGMTRDPDNELGHAEIFLKEENGPDPVVECPHGWPDSDQHASEALEQERRENAEFLAEVIFQIGLKVAEKAAPHVKKWWSEQAFPAMRTKWNGQALPSVKTKWASVRSRVSDRRAEAMGDLQDAITVPRDRRKVMSGAEARQRFAAAVAARIYSDGQLRLLRNARVVDEGENGPVEVEATDDLTPQRIGEQVALMLETDPSLLNEDTLAELQRLVASIRADGNDVLLQRAEGVPPHRTGAPEERATLEA